LVHVRQGQPERLAVPERRAEHLSTIGRGEDHPAYAERTRSGELVGEERHARGRQQGFGNTERQRTQPSALPADEQDGLKVTWNVLRHPARLAHYRLACRAIGPRAADTPSFGS